jgi:hypothetical protein
MNRDQMIDALLQQVVVSGEAPAPARRRLWRMSAPALRRELLLRGLMEYDDPPPEDEEGGDEVPSAYALLGWANGPVYVD